MEALLPERGPKDAVADIIYDALAEVSRTHQLIMTQWRGRALPDYRTILDHTVEQMFLERLELLTHARNSLQRARDLAQAKRNTELRDALDSIRTIITNLHQHVSFNVRNYHILKELETNPQGKVMYYDTSTLKVSEVSSRWVSGDFTKWITQIKEAIFQSLRYSLTRVSSFMALNPDALKNSIVKAVLILCEAKANRVIYPLPDTREEFLHSIQ